MKSIPTNEQKIFLNLYFQLHQPRRISSFGFFDIGKEKSFFDDELNEKIIRRVALNCYQPANLMFLDLIRRFPQTRITFSISGVALEQLNKYAPEVIDSFRKLAATGAVEFLGETYYHSLACLFSEREFIRQVKKHRQVMGEVLGITPTVFRNTELIYDDRVGRWIKKLGFRGVYVDGIEKVLQHHQPDRLYEHIDGNGLNLFLRNYSLSDDIAFRFSNHQWKEWPLTAEKYFLWLQGDGAGERLVNLGLDYETFGEHQKVGTGIFQFMESVIAAVAKSKKIRMVTPAEAMAVLKPEDRISVPTPVSWADKERDLSAWLGNDLQRDAFDTLKSLEKNIAGLKDPTLENSWSYLQTSDHFYYMSTKKGDDGKVHHYFSPYPSPYEAFINYMNVLSDLTLRVKYKRKLKSAPKPVIERKILQRKLMVN